MKPRQIAGGFFLQTFFLFHAETQRRGDVKPTRLLASYELLFALPLPRLCVSA